MNPQTLPFNSQFQSGLLYCLIADYEFLRQVIEDLEPKLLDAGEAHIKLLKLILFIYKKTKRPLSVEIIKNTILQGQKNKLYTEGDAFGMNAIVDSGKSLTKHDFEYIKEKCFDFLKKQTMALAFAKSLDFFDNGDFDTVYSIIGEAYKKSFGKENSLGMNYAEQLVHDRYLESPRKGIWKTGWDTLDGYLGGGLAKKECTTILSPTGRGKCHSANTFILMSDGTTKYIQDIVIGDKLMGPDGKSRNVLSTTKGYGELFTVTPVKGTPYTVNDVHLLSLKTTNSKDNLNLFDGQVIKPGHTAPIFIEAQALFKSNKTIKHCLKGWRPEAVSFANEYTDHIIPPYILGVWLGDGTSTKPEISQMDNEVVLEFKNYAKTIDSEITPYFGITDRCPQWAIKGKSKFREALKTLNLFSNKHIPNSYKMSSIQDRLELLAGLLDTDGSLHYEGYDFVQKDKQLAEDVVFIARSLGLAATISECEKNIKSTGFTGKYWRVTISGDCDKIPVRIEYKKAQPRKQKKNHLLTGIKIEKAGYGDYYGFELDGDKQYLLGDWQVTHNTAILCNLAVSAARQGMKTLFITLEMTELQIAQRFDSIISGYCSSDLVNISDAKVDLQNKIDRVFHNCLPIIKGFDRGTLSLGGLETYLEKYTMEYGEPDVLILDWLGCLKMPAGFDKKHEALAEVGDSLVNMSRQFNTSLLTAHQTNRSAVGADIYGYDSISESFASIHGFDVVLGLGSSNKAQDAGRRTLTIQKSRVGPDSVYVNLQGNTPSEPLTFKFVEAIPEEDEAELLSPETKKKKFV